ncbi:MAG: SUMF1/EgtB/PvdO family nonheme iron enzyme [Ardenticatenaceae bacterium]
MDLEGTMSAFMANVLSDLTGRVAGAASRSWQRTLKGDEGHQALEGCLSAGLLAIWQKTDGATTIQRDQLQDIFEEFFADEAVSGEIAQLLRGNRLNRKELAEIFDDLGYDATTLPVLTFEQAITLFEVGFLTAASEEPLFQPRIQTVQLIQQTNIQRESLAEIRALVAILREVGYNYAQIGAGAISHPQLGSSRSPVRGQSLLLAAPADDQAHAGLRQAYLDYLFTTLRKLSLSGIDPAATDSKAQLQLDGVYTALLTLSSEVHQPERRPEWGLLGREERLSALAQLDQHPRLVLMGDPGSGKSTFLNYVSLCLAGEALGNEQVNLHSLTAPLPKRDGEDEEERQPWQHGALLPVRVVLRDFAARGLPDSDQPMTGDCLWAFIEKELKVAQLAEFAPYLKAALREGQALLLLDGLDEVPEANQRRAQIKEAIICFTDAFPRCRVLVTSRTYAYQKAEWKLPGFSEAVLAPFTEGQISRFVTSWYAHLATQRHLNAQDAQGRAQLLQWAIERNERLQELAERPLLLTLMASLHAWHGSHLPEKREELYAEAVDLLLYQWERQRTVRDQSGKEIMQPSLAEWLKVDRDEVRKLLNQLAYEAHSSQPDMVGTADLPQMRLIKGLLDISPDRKIQLLELTHYLEHRAGLLLARGEGVYTFPHRTFQEYLAACHLADGDPADMAELARQEPNRWREVTLLAGAKVARGSKWQVWSYVDALCHTDVQKTGHPKSEAPAKRVRLLEKLNLSASQARVLPFGQKAKAPAAWGALLAGQLLVESADLSQVSKAHQPKLERVRTWQLEILRGDTLPAVERVLAGNTLAVLGDPRFRADKWYLPNERLLGFLEVPAGPFTMGSVDDSLKFIGSETPQHEVTLPTYWIARYPVTVAQWRAFVDATDHQPADADSLKGIVNHPARWVFWHEAMAYCQWLQQTLQKEAQERLAKGVLPAERAFWQGLSSGSLTLTLPSEAEWEKAARGVLTQEGSRTFPWGEKADPERANSQETGIGGTSSVGAFAAGASPYGCEEMSGNVWEWTRTIWGESYSKPEFEYPYDPKDGREEVSDKTAKKLRVLRGGSFAYSRRLVRCAARSHDDVHYDEGWRVVVSPSTSDL